jgi:hypothetical protein
VTNPEWIKLFRQIPQDLHNKLILILRNRSEVVVETIYRLEPAFAVMRARMGGTIEGGLLVMTPYNQITSIYVTREVPEENVKALFEAKPPAAQTETNGRLSGSHHASPMPEPSKPLAQQPVAPDPAALRNNLLERLRAARQAAAPANGK